MLPVAALDLQTRRYIHHLKHDEVLVATRDGLALHLDDSGLRDVLVTLVDEDPLNDDGCFEQELIQHLVFHCE